MHHIGCWDPWVPRVLETIVPKQLLKIQSTDLVRQSRLVLVPHVEVKLHPMYHVQRGEQGLGQH